MKTILMICCITFGLLFFIAYPLSADDAEQTHGNALPLVNKSKCDLATRLGVSRKEIKLQSIEATEFPDTSLGVPESGKMYAQVITPGYIIKLIVYGKTYEYHGSREHVVLVPQNN